MEARVCFTEGLDTRRGVLGIYNYTDNGNQLGKVMPAKLKVLAENDQYKEIVCQVAPMRGPD